MPESVVRSAEPRGTVILLHGFPETLYSYKDISRELARDYEVHSFDWPGYGTAFHCRCLAALQQT